MAIVTITTTSKATTKMLKPNAIALAPAEAPVEPCISVTGIPLPPLGRGREAGLTTSP